MRSTDQGRRGRPHCNPLLVQNHSSTEQARWWPVHASAETHSFAPGSPMTSPEPTSAEIWRARLLVLLAGLLWSSSGFFAKAPEFAAWRSNPLGGLTLSFWRAAF